MRIVPKPLASVLVGGKNRFATLWRIQRTDSVVLRLTDHCTTVAFNGETYSPMDGKASVTATATARAEGLLPTDVDVSGVISSTEITAVDLAARRYDDAVIVENVVDWAYPWLGALRSYTYYVQEVKHDVGETWTATTSGPIIRLRPKFGDVVSRTCRWRKVGDADCGVNLASFTQTGRSVQTVVVQRSKFTTTASGSNGIFDDGELAWTTGANSGLKFEVKKFKSTGGEIELHVDTPFDVSVGDQFSASQGCDRRFETCKTKFNNVNRFGGRPYVPGNDAQFSTPESR